MAQGMMGSAHMPQQAIMEGWTQCVKVNGVAEVWLPRAAGDLPFSLPLCHSRCTSCLSTRWKCHWCPSTYTCVSNHSQCDDVLQMKVSPSHFAVLGDTGVGVCHFPGMEAYGLGLTALPL